MDLLGAEQYAQVYEDLDYYKRLVIGYVSFILIVLILYVYLEIGTHYFYLL